MKKKPEQQMKETGLSRALGGIEYEQDFSILVCWLHVIPSPTDIRAGSLSLFLSRDEFTCYISSHALLSLPKTNMKSEGSGNVTGWKLKKLTLEFDLVLVDQS